MLQQIWLLLPSATGGLALAVALLGVIAGLFLWLRGARISLYVSVALAAAVGGWVGMELPAALGWPIHPWAAAILGVVAIGASGYALHHAWVGLALGAVVGAWALLGAWMLLAPTEPWNVPAPEMGQGLMERAQAAWAALPAEVRRPAAWSAIGSIVCGLALCILWPLTSTAILHSLLGATLVCAMGLAAVKFCGPQRLGVLPPPSLWQAIALLLMVALGVVLQWPASARPAPAQKDLKD